MTTAKQIQHDLAGYCRMRAMNCIILGNVYLLDSPWECDLLKVMPSGYFVEYEIKLTQADFKNDFEKHIGVHSEHFDNRVFKHKAYANAGPILDAGRFRKDIPKPKQFYFVVPDGLISADAVPSHCGLITHLAGSGGWNCSVVKTAPNLKQPTKLEYKHVYNLAVKAGCKAIDAERAIRKASPCPI